MRDLPRVPAGRCEVPILRHFTATGKTQEVPASRLRASSRTQQILHSEVLVEDSAGSLELSLPALSSYQYVHGNFKSRDTGGV